MEHSFLAFDIETVKLAPADASDWRPYRPLGISCAATLAKGQDEPQIWHGGRNYKRPTYRMNRDAVCKLVGYLGRQVVDGYTIVTWNGAGFDFDILAEESGMVDTCKRLARDHVDMMFHVLCQLGFGISLGAVAKGMGLPGKAEEMSGAVAPQFWAEGKRAQVLEYVAQDVRTTLALAEMCESERLLCWVTRSGRKRQMALPRGWFPVRAAQKLPQPITFWMTAQWPREKFAGWLQ
jgi:hypothetical protein